jgi:hypothetical protein
MTVKFLNSYPHREQLVRFYPKGTMSYMILDIGGPKKCKESIEKGDDYLKFLFQLSLDG